MPFGLFKGKQKKEQAVNIASAEPVEKTEEELLLESGLEAFDDFDDEFAKFQEETKEWQSGDTPPPSPPPPAAPPLQEPVEGLSDIDRQLAALLAQDEQADAAFKNTGIDERLREQTIYDADTKGDLSDGWEAYTPGGELGTRASAMHEKRLKITPWERVQMLPKSILAFATGVLILFILGAGLTVAAAMRSSITKKSELARISYFTPITQPADAVNNANFIYLNERQSIGGQNFTLRKMSAGRLGTWFYFDEAFDASEYDIILYDQERTLYHLYAADTERDPRGGTALKFDTLNGSSVFLTLHIRHTETNADTAFYYRFEQPPSFTAPVYITSPLRLPDTDDALHIVLEQATFGDTGTEILYSIENGIRFGGGSDPAIIEMRDGVQLLPATAKQPSEYLLGDLLIGRMNFSPVRSLNTPLELTFKEIYYAYAMPGARIDLKRLFSREGDSAQTFYVGGNELTLEGMDTQGDYVVLVVHAENSEGERVETRVEAELSIDTDSGALTIPGDCRISPMGSDILFDISGVKAQINGLPISRYSLKLDTVQYYVPSISVTLRQYQDTQDTKLEEAAFYVRSAFMSRLAYKSQYGDFKAVSGFAPEVLQDRALMRRYAPFPVNGLTPMYAAKAVAGIIYDNQYLCIVEDEWVIGEGEDMVHFKATHKVAAEYRRGGWTIISDEIIR